jgi:methylphosphotriester-DNA--protein-cysteine methyltransferase
MEWVAERLVETGRQVRSVADQLGMDPFQLSRTFRRTFGLSPTEFVRLRRG